MNKTGVTKTSATMRTSRSSLYLIMNEIMIESLFETMIDKLFLTKICNRLFPFYLINWIIGSTCFLLS